MVLLRRFSKMCDNLCRALPRGPSAQYNLFFWHLFNYEVFKGSCWCCTWWIRKWRQVTILRGCYMSLLFLRWPTSCLTVAYLATPCGFHRYYLCLLSFPRVHSPLSTATNAICLFGIIVCLVFVNYDHFLFINPLDFEPFLLSLLCLVSAVTWLKDEIRV